MKKCRLLMFGVVGICAAGCEPKPHERVSYYDRNGDGKVDLEIHKVADAKEKDWALSDNDYDGRYELETHLGVVIKKVMIDRPVPTGVRVEPAP